MEFSINYLAVVLGAVSNLVIGSLWYGPIFGKQWMALMGFTSDSVKSMPLSMGQAMGGGVVVALLMSFVMAHTLQMWQVVDMGGALMAAFWTWLGFIVPVSAGSFLWEGKPIKLFVLNAANWFVSLFVMSLILTWL